MDYFYRHTCIFLLMIFLVSCSGTKGESNLSKYQSFDDAAREAMLADRYDDAFNNFKAANDVAIKMQWREGQVFSKIGMAGIKRIQKKSDEAEGFLLDAKDLCLQKPFCTKDAFIPVVDALMFEYIYQPGDIDKAIKFGEEIVSLNGQILSSEELYEVMKNYLGHANNNFPSEKVAKFRAVFGQ